MSVAGRAPADDQPRRLGTGQTDWFATTQDSEGLPYYVAILRSNMWFIVVTVAVCVGAALLYLAQAQKVYQADADLLVTPVPRGNDSLIGLGLPLESADPTRDVQTLARLIQTPPVARRVIKELGLGYSPQALLAKIEAKPVAGSNVVSVTAQANTPVLSAQIANAFGNASVDYRTERLRRQLNSVIPALRRQIAQLPVTDPGRQPLVERLRDLEALRSGKDPTIRLETAADPPTTQISPRPTLSIAAAILAGLIVGGAAALGAQLLDPRLRREEQLRRYRIPILARVPMERKGRGQGPLLPGRVSPVTQDGYLLLAATLSADHTGQGAKRSVLVTGPGSGDGKTTSALNLATSLSESERVILVEGDARRPTLARAYKLSPKHNLATVVARRIPLSEALVNVWSGAPRLQVLAQNPDEKSGASAVMTPASADWLIRQAELLASWVVVDAPPIALVPDVIPLAKRVDEVILVVRLGNTRLKHLEELAELLVQQGITPAGFVVIGGKSHSAYYG